ncbi:MAG: PDDEXK nuclease domain-containing protein [Desulfobacteraceae bacterium]|nr:PDDEXK nuclease domain-containing protein [Desulfobacteraceae bacterium]
MTISKRLSTAENALVQYIRGLIEEARATVATTVNAALTTLYWRVGRRIHEEILKGDRAGYGDKIVHALSAQLRQDYGQGFTERNLFNMIRFAQVFPHEEIVTALRTQLNWTHFRILIAIDDPLKRDFYAEMCRIDRWSTRTLQARIDSMLFERTALSKKPDELIRLELDALRKEDRLTPDLVFRDPYFLDFLGLKDRYLEKDFEDAILRELEQFLLELGGGFSFVARQKRIQVDSDDYYIDLLFFHRKLRRLVAIELKLGDFKPADKGQMELYLRWLDKNERQANEEPPIGLILCAGKKNETVALLELEKSSIRVAQYFTELPSREILKQKLHKALVQARQRFALSKALDKEGAR